MMNNESEESYITCLLNLKEDPSLKVRWRIVQGISMIMDFNIELVLDRFNEVSDLMLKALKEHD